MLVRVLHTFGNKIEGKRVHKDSIIDVSELRFKALRTATPSRPLVRELTADELERYGNRQPKAKVEPDSKPPSKPRPLTSIPSDRPQTAPNPRRETKAKTKSPPRGSKAKQPEEPEAPRPLARGGRGGSPAPAASSSQAGPAPAGSITRQRGTRTPKSGGSQSTTPSS